MFYEQFIKLCKERDVKPTVVAESIGLNKSTATGWKRGTTPTDVTIKKLADYFGVSVDELDPKKEQKKTTVESDDGLSDTKKTAIYLIENMPEEELERKKDIIFSVLKF